MERGASSGPDFVGVEGEAESEVAFDDAGQEAGAKSEIGGKQIALQDDKWTRRGGELVGNLGLLCRVEEGPPLGNVG